MKRNQWWQATRTVMVVSVLISIYTSSLENGMMHYDFKKH